MINIVIFGANSYIGDSFKEYLSQWSNEYSVDIVDTLTEDWKNRDYSKYQGAFQVAGIAGSHYIQC